MTSLPRREESLRIERAFPLVAPATLFSYWTLPELLVQWWPQQVEIEAVVGGRLHLAWPDANWHLRGVITAYRPNALLRFTWSWEHLPDAPTREVTVEIRPLGEGSMMLLRDGPYAEGEETERLQHREGWEHFLDRLAATLGAA